MSGEEDNNAWYRLATAIDGNLDEIERDYGPGFGRITGWEMVHDVVERAGWSDPLKGGRRQGYIPNEAALNKIIKYYNDNLKAGREPGVRPASSLHPSITLRETATPPGPRQATTQGQRTYPIDVKSDIRVGRDKRKAVYKGIHANLDGSDNPVNVFGGSGIHGIGFGPADFRGAWLDPEGYTAQSILDFLNNDYKDPKTGKQYPISWTWKLEGDPRPLRAESMKTILERAASDPDSEKVTDFLISSDAWPEGGMDFVEGFDVSDYKVWMLRVAQERPGDTLALRTLRQDVLDWIATRKIDIDDDFRKALQITRENTVGFEFDYTGTTYWDDRNDERDPTKPGKITKHLDSFFGAWADTAYSKAEEKRRFNNIDVLSMQAAGFDDFDIYMYMKKNQDKMKVLNEDGTYGDWIPGSVNAFNAVRDRLIERGNYYIRKNYDINSDDNDYREHRAEIVMHPHIREVAEIAQRVKRGDENPHDLVNNNDFKALQKLLWVGDENKTTTSPDIRGHHIRDLEDWNVTKSIFGDYDRPGYTVRRVGDGPGAGEYWKQYGTPGPQFNLSDDLQPEYGLSDVQGVVVRAGVYADRPREWTEETFNARIDSMERLFLAKLGWGAGTSSRYTDDQGNVVTWETAPDDWGLDIMRRVWNRDEQRWDSVNVGTDTGEAQWTDSGAAIDNSWFTTITTGEVDWAFYDDSAEYTQARRALGLPGKYDEFKNVAEIRAANSWVAGQTSTVISSATEGGVPVPTKWIPYEPRFDSETAQPWTRTELDITGYEPRSRKSVEVPTTINVPTVNVVSNEFRVPSILDNWPHQTPESVVSVTEGD